MAQRLLRHFFFKPVSCSGAVLLLTLPHGLGHLGNAYARSGHQAEATAIVPRLKKHVDKTGVGRYEIALVYAGLQENDQAFEWLEKCYHSRNKGLT